MHLESASASHCGASANLLDQSDLHGGSVAKVETIMHLESASASHPGASTSLLDQSELHGGSVAKANTCRRLVTAASTHHPEVPVAETTSMHLESATISPWSSHKFARSVGASRRLRCKDKYLQAPGHGGKHSPSDAASRVSLVS